MSIPTDEQWAQTVAAARQDLQVERLRVEQPRLSNRKLNLTSFAVPLCVFLLAWMYPKQLEGLALAVGLGGGLCALCVLAGYATSNRVSHTAKEAAFCFLLGDLILLGLLMLDPV